MLTIGAMLLAIASMFACGGRGNRNTQVVPGFDNAPPAGSPMTEDALIAEFHRLFPDAEKRPAELMNPQLTVVDDLAADLITEDEHGASLDPPLTKLTFSATNYADYNNDTVVDIKDITPLAARFNTSYDDSPLPEEILSPRLINGHPDTLFNRQIAATDGNGDGAVNISDLTPIAANFNAELSGYNIYRAEVIDSLLTWSEVSLGNLLDGASSLSVSIAEWTDAEEALTGNTASAQGRLFFELTTEAPPEGETYGFRASAFGHGEEGPYGNAATVSRPSTEDTTPPYWLDKAGISGTRALDEGVEVSWGTAVDAKSPPVHYRIYYSAGTELDWGSATVIDDVASPYEIYGLTTLEPYTFAVRACDSSADANEEANTVTLTEYPGPRDSYPPEWQTAVGITNVVGTEDGFIVTWELAKDFYDDGTTIWESDPVRYRIYWSRTSPIDFATAEFIEVDASAPDQPWQWYEFIGGFDHETRYYFAVRTVDSAEPTRNEDENTETLYGFIPEWDIHYIYDSRQEPVGHLLAPQAPFLLVESVNRPLLVWMEKVVGEEETVYNLWVTEFQGTGWSSYLLAELHPETPTGDPITTIRATELINGVLYVLLAVRTGGLAEKLVLVTWDGSTPKEETVAPSGGYSHVTLVPSAEGIAGVSFFRPSGLGQPDYNPCVFLDAANKWEERVLFDLDADRYLSTTIYQWERFMVMTPSLVMYHLLGLYGDYYARIDENGAEFPETSWLQGEEQEVVFWSNDEVWITARPSDEERSQNKLPYGWLNLLTGERDEMRTDQHPLVLRDWGGDPVTVRKMSIGYKSATLTDFTFAQVAYPESGYAVYVFGYRDGLGILKFAMDSPAPFGQYPLVKFFVFPGASMNTRALAYLVKEGGDVQALVYYH